MKEKQNDIIKNLTKKIKVLNNIVIYFREKSYSQKQSSKEKE